MPSILSIHHAQITIPKGAEAIARRYYCDILGLPELEKPAALAGRGGFWLQAPGMQIHVGAEDGVDRLATKGHVAYEVSDLKETARLLQDNGFDVLEGPAIPGLIRFESRDPFGNRIEFVCRT